MEPSPVSFGDALLSLTALAVAVLIVPGLLTWWAIAQRVNHVRRKAGRQRVVGRWHCLRFGPLAPLLALSAFLIGMAPFLLQPSELKSFGLVLSFGALTVLGLVAFLMSMVLWSYASNPADTAEEY
jgi:hypothetical protein